MRKTIIVALILVLLISGCAAQTVDIDTGKQLFKNCTLMQGVDRYTTYVGNACDTVCSQAGLNNIGWNYKIGWKCSSNNTVVCECSK